MGRPDSVWRLTDCLWNLCVRYLSGFLKTDLVTRLSVTVRRLVIAQNRKQRSAIKNAPSYNLVRVREARFPFSSGTQKLDNDQTNSLSEGVVVGSIPARLSHFIIRRNQYAKIIQRNSLCNRVL